MNPDTLTAIGGGAGAIVAILFVALGLLNCFAGYRVFRFMVAVYGFIVGAVVATWIAGDLAADQLAVQVIAALVGGFLGAALISILYFVGVFAVGAAAGALLANLGGTSLGHVVPDWGLVIAAVVVGLLALAFQRTGIILVTAAGGAWAAVDNAAALAVGRTATAGGLIGREHVASPGSLLWLILLAVWLILAVVGAVVQFRTSDK